MFRLTAKILLIPSLRFCRPQPSSYGCKDEVCWIRCVLMLLYRNYLHVRNIMPRRIDCFLGTGNSFIACWLYVGISDYRISFLKTNSDLCTIDIFLDRISLYYREHCILSLYEIKALYSLSGILEVRFVWWIIFLSSVDVFFHATLTILKLHVTVSSRGHVI